MANKRIKGITVEIGGDTIGLNKALGETNGKIRDTQSELKSVERLLKLDPTNTQLLEQRQKLLTKAIADTGSKLVVVKQAEKQAQEQFAKGEMSEEAYRKLEREVVATEQSLKNLEAQASKSNVAVAKIASTAGQLGEKATALGKKLTPVSAVAGAAAVGMSAMAVKAGQAADDINTLSKQTGLSTAQIQKFQFASDRIDVSMEVLTGSMSKLTKNMATASKGTGDASKAFNELGVRVTNTDGSLRSNQDVFDDTIKALGRMTNETQRDAYAMQIFGKSAQDLNPLILGGADALKQMGDEAESMGLILSQDTLDEVNAFADEVDEMKAVASGTFAAIGGEIAMAFLPVMRDLSKLFIDLSRWIRTVDQDTLRMIVTIFAIVASMAPLLIAIGKVATGISALSGAIMFLCSHPVVILAAALAALVAAFSYLWVTDEGFRNSFVTGWEMVADIFKTIGDFIASIFTDVIPSAFRFTVDMIQELPNIFITCFKAPFNLIISMINAVISAVNKAVSWLNNLTLPGFLGGGSIGFSLGSIPNIPMLAQGGTLLQGSAIVGERGPELLSIINGKSVVQPLSGGQSGGVSGALGSNTYVTNYINVDAGNMAQLQKVIKIMDGEKRVMRMGYEGGR